MPRAILVLSFALAFTAGIAMGSVLPCSEGACTSSPSMLEGSKTRCDEADDTAEALDAMLDADEPSNASLPMTRAAASDLGGRPHVE